MTTGHMMSGQVNQRFHLKIVAPVGKQHREPSEVYPTGCRILDMK